MFGRDKPATPSAQTPAPQPSARNEAAPAAGAPMPPASKAAGQPSKIETIIGANCRMNGMLQSDGGIRIEGVFEGQIQTAGNLVVSDTAKVAAEIQAYNVVVSGTVRGNVTANRIEITETGKLFGDLNVNTLLLSEGAYLRGQTNMAGDVEPPLVETPKIEPPRPVESPALDSPHA
jgi:cytoskeletal protein CcmA (bactofilin family)